MLQDVAWTGFGLIEILGRYGAVRGTVILMPMRRGVSTVADSAVPFLSLSSTR